MSARSRGWIVRAGTGLTGAEECRSRHGTRGRVLGKDQPVAILPLSPDKLLSTTRSVRRRLDLTRSVPMALVRECLEVALQAPTGGNQQGWHWLVITDPDLRTEIATRYRRSYVAYRAEWTSTRSHARPTPRPGRPRDNG